MNTLLYNYNKKKASLLEIYTELLDKKVIPCEFGSIKHTIQEIDELKQTLEDEVFTISVCGQINAGKSTFLNYLLFNGESVLPADDTPWTAKLSTISYGEKEEAIVTFYSTEEWSCLKEQSCVNDHGANVTYYDLFLKEEVDRIALDEGIYAEEFIKPTARIQKNIPLSTLEAYVAKGGKYTPFVNHIQIETTNELAKGVTFVDTPGLNDRNVLRSKVTEDWISRSSAVIYLLYTGQPLGNSDYDFIDKHLLAVPSSKIMFVVTKADTSSDYQGAVDYIDETLRLDENLKKRKLLEDKKVYPISTISAIIDEKNINNIELSEDEEFHLERIEDECPEFLENKGYVPNLIEAVQENIMKDKGYAILEKHIRTIEAIVEHKSKELELRSTKAEDLVDNLKLSVGEMQAKVNSLTETSKDISRIEKDYKDCVKSIQTNEDNDLIVLIKELRDQSIDTFKNHKDLLNCSTNNLYIEAAYIAKNIIENSIMRVPDLLKDNSLENKISGIQETFNKKIKDVLNKRLECKYQMFFPSVFSIDDCLKNIDTSKLSQDALKKLKVSTCIFFTDKEATRANIRNSFAKELEEIFEENVINKVKGGVQKSVEAYSSEFLEPLYGELKKYQSELAELIVHRKNSDCEMNEAKQKLAKCCEVQETYKELSKVLLCQLDEIK